MITIIVTYVAPLPPGFGAPRQASVLRYSAIALIFSVDM